MENAMTSEFILPMIRSMMGVNEDSALPSVRQFPVVADTTFNLWFTSDRTGYANANPITMTWNSANWEFEFDNFKPECGSGCPTTNDPLGTSTDIWKLTRTVLPGTNESSLSYFMMYVFEKYFRALPQMYGWFYLQRFFGLQEWCDLQQSNFSASTWESECY